LARGLKTPIVVRASSGVGTSTHIEVPQPGMEYYKCARLRRRCYVQRLWSVRRRRGHGIQALLLRKGMASAQSRMAKHYVQHLVERAAYKIEQDVGREASR